MVMRESWELSLAAALDNAGAVDGGQLIAARVGARTGRVAAGQGTRTTVTMRSPQVDDGAGCSRSVAPALTSKTGNGTSAIVSPLPQLPTIAGSLCQPGGCSCTARSLAAPHDQESFLIGSCSQTAAELGEGPVHSMVRLAARVNSTTGRSRDLAAGHGTGAFFSSCPRVNSTTGRSPDLAACHGTGAFVSSGPRVSSTSTTHCTQCLLRGKKRMMNGSAAAQEQPCWVRQTHSSWRAANSLSGWIMHQINRLFLGLGFKSPLFVLRHWSWIGVMGAPVVQLENEGSCTISACTGCTEAQHRLAYERVHGWGSFPCTARVPPTHLKLECLKRKVWDPKEGAWTPQIFKVIMDIGGIPTTRSTKGVRLNINGYTVYDVPRALTPKEAATLLYMRGPFVSVLWANDEYEDYDDTSDTVYRGFIPSGVTGGGSASGTSNEGLHAVISFDYTFVETELWIHIMDSHTEVGPYRMILYEAFVYFILPRVDKAIELPKQ